MKRFEKTKGFIMGALVTALLLAAAPGFAASVKKQITAHVGDFRLVVNGKEVLGTSGKPIQPILIDGMVYAPASTIAKGLGQSSRWDADKRIFYVGDNGTTPPTATGVGSPYQSIYEEYSKKLREATPKLIREYNQEAATNTKGLTGLAEIMYAKITELAKINQEGIEKMADAWFKKGSGKYSEYEQAGMKLGDVYMEESAKISDVYLKSAAD